MATIYEKYASAVHATSGLSAELVMERSGSLEVFYAPFDHINRDAKVVLVGITPGEFQASAALDAARRLKRMGATEAEILAGAKATASFSGTAMRRNLGEMLDVIGLHRMLGIGSSAELFTDAGSHIHLTSALRYPVLVGGKNYNRNPDMLRTPVLRQMIDTYLAEEVQALGHAIWLPLGPKPAVALRHLINRRLLNEKQVLDGIPHPSGANAERVAAFLGKVTAETASRVTNVPKIMAAKEALVSKVVAFGRDTALQASR